MVGKLIKFLLLLAFLGFAIVVAYAYLGNMKPEQNLKVEEIRLGAT